MKIITFLSATFFSILNLIAAESGLSSGGFGPQGALQLHVQGAQLQIEYSTNLAHWVPLSSGRGTVLDAGATNSEWRFYRGRESNSNFVSNIVGYVRVSVPPGKLAVLASPFSAPVRLTQPAELTAILGTATPPAQVYLAKGGKQTAYTFDELDNKFQPPVPEIPWGTGFIV